MKHTALPWHVAANATIRDKKGDYIFEDRPQAEIAENKVYAELACNNFEEMRRVLGAVLDHVEDMDVQRTGAQCTLCSTYRGMIRSILQKIEDESK